MVLCQSCGLRAIAAEPTFRQRMKEFVGLPQAFLSEDSGRIIRYQARINLRDHE